MDAVPRPLNSPNDCLVLLEGGHKVYLAETSPSETEVCISNARTDCLEFVYFQPPNYPTNAIAIDPTKVVAVVAHRNRGY